MEENTSTVVATIVAFAGVFALGSIFSVLGSVKLKLAQVLQIDDAKVGGLISAMMFSCMISVLIIGPLQDRLGYAAIAIIGFLGGAICMWILASATNYGIALVACLLMGIGAMSVNTVGNVLGPQLLFAGENPAAASNLLNAFFGLGAFVTPFIAASLLNKLGYRSTVGIIGAMIFAPVILVFFAQFPPADADFNPVEAIGLLARGGVLLGGLSLFFYIGLEISMAGFITTYLKSFDMTDEKAGYILSGFWIAIIVTRLIAGIFVLSMLAPSLHAALVPLLAIIAVFSISLMVKAKEEGPGTFATILTGLAMGPIFPTLVGVSFFKVEVSGSVFGWIFALGLLGGTIIPMFIGKYSARLDIRQSMKIAVGVAAALVIVSAILWLGVPDPADPEPVIEALLR